MHIYVYSVLRHTYMQQLIVSSRYINNLAGNLKYKYIHAVVYYNSKRQVTKRVNPVYTHTHIHTYTRNRVKFEHYTLKQAGILVLPYRVFSFMVLSARPGH